MGGCEMYAAFSRLAGHSMGAESVMLEAGAQHGRRNDAIREMRPVGSPVRQRGIDTASAGGHYRDCL
jgi:hypothetical protein